MMDEKCKQGSAQESKPAGFKSLRNKSLQVADSKKREK
jgi:hypothetical protein